MGLTIPIIPLLVTLVTALFLLVRLSPIAMRIGLVDRPNQRKHHHVPIPLVGGISIIAGFFMGALLLDGSLGPFRGLFFATTLLLIVGMLDDYRESPPAFKFFSQILVGIIFLYYSDLAITNIGDIFNRGVPQGLSILAPVFFVASIVGVINAFNMIDGIDGLAASNALITIMFLAGLAILQHESEAFSILLLISGGTLVFLFFNLTVFMSTTRKAFLGDTGSMFLGLVIVYFLIFFTKGESNILPVPAAPWLIALPLFDMASVMVDRLVSRTPIYMADRKHLHHVLLSCGLRSPIVLIFLIGLQLLLSSVGIIGQLKILPEWILFWALGPSFLAFHFGKRLLIRHAVAKAKS